MSTVRHIYLHVPFCSGKCSYCSFYSTPYDKNSIENYLDAIQREIKSTAARYNIQAETIYFGGGTPSLLPGNLLKKLLKSVSDNIGTDKLTEWTLEGNPGTITPEKADILREYGINRISLGAQSMNDSILALAERRHTAEDTKQTVRLLQSAGFDNIGLDLIACLPGATKKIWQQTLDEIIELNPQHISVYALSIEPGSKLYAKRKPKQKESAAACKEQTALAHAESKLEEAAFNHYEVSNYARKGFRCRHNTAVWLGADYIGFGPAAASRIGLERRTNTPDLTQYCKLQPPPADRETLSPKTDAAERFMFCFRLYDGIKPTAFAEEHGLTAKQLLPFWLKQLGVLGKQGLVSNNNNNWSLTSKGRDFADTVAEKLLPDNPTPLRHTSD